MGRSKKRQNKILSVFSFVFYFLGSFSVFLFKELWNNLRGSHEEIIYKARYFRRKHKPKEFKVKITFLRRIGFGTKVKIFLVFLVFIFISIFSIWYFIFRDLPSPKQLVNRKVQVSTKIYDRNGILLYQIYKDENRTLVPFSIIPADVKKATLASEDAGFYTNHGYSIKGIIRAIFTNFTHNGVTEGGSTITQQLVKNTLLTNERTITRKIKELVLAIEVESEFSKDQILEMYLNEIPYGGANYGIEAASEMYFGKSVSQLDLAESALLAGLPKSPTTYSPYGENPELATQRQREVLDLMYKNNFINKDQENAALNEKLNFSNNQTDIKAPHFVMYVRQKLVDEYGEDLVNSGGLSVITTLDYKIQQIAEAAVKNNIDKLKGFHVTNGAAIVMDPNSGEILAMVGSKDYFDTTIDGNVNVTTALRPPGSSIKIVNYAYALSHGYTPASIILDAPITYKFAGSPAYSPVNYDGKFVGNLTLRSALAQSRNIPAVKILASYGVTNMIKMGQDMGITTWNELNTYGLSLTLGGGSTKLLDLARVFSTVAALGTRPTIQSIKTITDYKGFNIPTICDSATCDKKEILDSKVAYQLIDILSDNNARAPEFGIRSALFIPNHPEVAVKTGTSNDLRDNLTIGFNQKYLTAVWVGNNDNSPMARIASGITGAAPIWNEIESKLVGSEATKAWPVPQGLININFGCSNKKEWFIDGTQPKQNICIKEATASAQFINN